MCGKISSQLITQCRTTTAPLREAHISDLRSYPSHHSSEPYYEGTPESSWKKLEDNFDGKEKFLSSCLFKIFAKCTFPMNFLKPFISCSYFALSLTRPAGERECPGHRGRAVTGHGQRQLPEKGSGVPYALLLEVSLIQDSLYTLTTSCQQQEAKVPLEKKAASSEVTPPDFRTSMLGHHLTVPWSLGETINSPTHTPNPWHHESYLGPGPGIFECLHVISVYSQS